ncbi:MAG: DUF4239 domain-containing protein [Hymenobacteraceae bacterium]|nr:DUF4239 domain-containing protein [Hymenobacteraceae bacterium]MDX5397548.1 DUF4239 domain-containing protein [Hymenobacteraceae bacterium]MDX5513626.1 DUF4239 domain-containing protein [Hymenobacteraceae bacterium]
MTDLATQPFWLIAICFISFGILVALGSFISSRKLFPEGVIAENGVKPATLVGTVIGSLFALLLALILVTVWQNYEKQKERTIMEAVALANLYRSSNGLNSDQSQAIKQLTINYTRNLIEFSWDSMEKGHESKVTFNSFQKLYSFIINYVPSSQKEEIIYREMIDHLNELANYRRLRLITVKQNNIPITLWFIIISVGIVSVCYTNFFYIGNKYTQATVISLHASIIAVILMLVFLLNHPYRGTTKIKPTSFKHLLENVYPASEQKTISNIEL